MHTVELLEGAFVACLRSVNGREATRRTARSWRLSEPPTVLALGKAAIDMAWGLHDAVGPLRTGVVVSDVDATPPPGLEVVVGGHPLPGIGSLRGGRALLGAAASAPAGGLVVVLVSGGGSALAEALRPDVSLKDLRLTTELLLRSGAPIDDVNMVRTALSVLKGGGLAAAAAHARVVTLAISDVVGDDPAAIASGPTVRSATDSAATVLERWGIADRVPETVRRTVAEAADIPRASGDAFTIVASRRDAAAAAASWLRSRTDLDVVVVDTDLTGEASLVAQDLVAASATGRVGVCAGETTVTVTGNGSGGRNQEAALAAAITIDGDPSVVFLAAGTDGKDGTADGAGAVVDGGTAASGRRAGRDPVDHLRRNDAGGFFDVVPGRIEVGRTGTNVGDVWMVARTP